MSINNLEIRMAHLEGAYEQIDKRLGVIEGDVRDLWSDLVSRMDGLSSRLSSQMDGLSSRMDGLSSRMDGLRSKLVSRMDRQFFWVLGLLIVSILLPIALRTLGR